MTLKEALLEREKQNDRGIKSKPLILDGGFGTMVQNYRLKEEDFRGYRFRSLPGMLLGNNEMLNLTRPDIVSAIHTSYIESGVDIITANTFSANYISQKDYNCEELVREQNKEAVRIAREAFEKCGKKGYVIATLGPTNKSLSISPDINDPAHRSITFDELANAYYEQMCVLIEEGVDAVMLETIFDTLNAKAGIYALQKANEYFAKDTPLMLSVTVNDANGRLLTGQTLEAFIISVSHAEMISIGLNCSFGADELIPVLRRLHHAVKIEQELKGRVCISFHPNAGLPNSMGQYDVTPEKYAQSVSPMIKEGLVDIIGGCCGTTPEHIKAIVDLCG